MKKELQAGTTADSSTKAHETTSASLAQNTMLSAAVSVEKGNKLIAEFMGIDEIVKFGFDNNGNSFLNYEKSWNALMPVVEKIENLKVTVWGDEIKYFEFTIKNKYCLIMGHTNIRQPGIYYQTPYGFVPDSKIHAVWLAVVEFIKWFNDNAAANR